MGEKHPIAIFDRRAEFQADTFSAQRNKVSSCFGKQVIYKYLTTSEVRVTVSVLHSEWNYMLVEYITFSARECCSFLGYNFVPHSGLHLPDSNGPPSRQTWTYLHLAESGLSLSDPRLVASRAGGLAVSQG